MRAQRAIEVILRQSQKPAERFTSEGKPIHGRRSTQAAAGRGLAVRREAAPRSSPPRSSPPRPAPPRPAAPNGGARPGRCVCGTAGPPAGRSEARPGGVRGASGSPCPLCAPGGLSGCRWAGRWSVNASCGVKAVCFWALLSAALTALLCQQEWRMRRGLSSKRL